jgi:hypothetical protein
VPASELGGVVEMDLSNNPKAKELSNRTNNNSKAETIPIKISELKSYSSAEDNNVTKKEAKECNVNVGYDATSDEPYVTDGSTAVQKCEKDTSDSKNEKQSGEKEREKYTKDSEN